MINTELYKEAMDKIHGRLLAEKELFNNVGISAEGASEEESIDNLIRKSEYSSFKLLVMGRFSSGKSAFVNALLGEKVLPEKALPTTALITEVYYGEEKRAVIYPKKGKWQGGDEPFDIEPTLEEIAKYSTINNNAGLNRKEANRVDSCFEKMVIYWPIEILKDGVSIIDSPGTDDPYSNDYIVEAYVPKADAILYCINGTTAYCMKDKQTLDIINSKGFTPIIVTTYFDVVTDGLFESEKMEFIDATLNHYVRHTSKENCHYVNSRLGLASKRNNSHSDFVESGYNELEKFLGEYLTENKGREKVAGVTNSVRVFNNNQIRHVAGIISGLDVSLEEFNVQVESKEKALRQAELQGEFITREFRLETKNAQKEIEQLIPGLFDMLYENINLDDFEPDTSFSMWSPKKSSTQIAEECSKELEIRNKELVARWNNEVFTPRVTETFKGIVEKIQEQIDTFESDINKANLTINASSETVNTNVDNATRIGMFAWALLTGDWMTALMGGIFGASTFGRTILCQFAVGLVLGIAGLFTPIGIPTLIIGSLGATILGVGWSATKAAATIKKQSVKGMRESLLDDKDQIIANATEQCLKVLAMAEEKLHDAIAGDIEEVKKNIEAMKKERDENREGIQERKNTLTGVMDFLNETNKDISDIRAQFNI